MGVKVVTPPHAGAIWRERLGSAFRTAIACTIIGGTALYGPEPVRHQILYPSVAYVTAILIVSDATLGGTLRGSLHALGATIIVLPSSILCLWVVGPWRFTEAGAAAAVAMSAFLVALPECLPLLAKRIAFAQMVIIYVGAVVRGREAGPVTHPVHIAACTALGASASVLALILPYPRLAVTEVMKQFRLYAENASERASLYMKAFLSQDNATAHDLMSQAEPVSESGTKLLNHINRIQEGMKWERYRIRDFKRSFVKMEDRIDDMETPIKGMKLALAAVPSFPLDIVNEELRNVLQSARVKHNLKPDQVKCFVPFDEAMTVPETKDKLFDKSLQSLSHVIPTQKRLPAFFFLSCFELLVNNSSIHPKPESLDGQNVNKAEGSKDRVSLAKSSNKRLVFALKCSISLALAVLLGMMFDKKNGYWSGLTIAISFVEGRQAIFTVANARVQGTAIGTVYGVLGSCLLQHVAEIRFIILLPWIVFTSMLHHSQMFGESGGISAVIGALLILGRKNYGPPKEFAIARLTEVSIGLFCMVMLEIILEPVRAATLVQRQLSRCLETLDECLHQMACHKENVAPYYLSQKKNLKRLKSDVNYLKKLSKDAKAEPNFWFMPFRASCYENVQERLSKMVDLLQIMIYNLEFITSLSQSHDDGAWKELQEHINHSTEMLKKNASPRVKRLQTITLKSIDNFEHHLQEREKFRDLESGNQSDSEMTFGTTEADTKLTDVYIERLKEVTDKIHGDEEFKGKTILHLNSLGFCIGSLMAETMEVEKQIKHIIRCENPSRHVDFSKLCYKKDIMKLSTCMPH